MGTQTIQLKIIELILTLCLITASKIFIIIKYKAIGNNGVYDEDGNRSNGGFEKINTAVSKVWVNEHLREKTHRARKFGART